MNGNIVCAIRGPILMITLGVLLAVDQMGTAKLRPHLADSVDRVRIIEAGRASRISRQA